MILQDSKQTVIAAVKNQNEMERALRLPGIQTLFLLYGNISELPRMTQKVREADKQVFVHTDLISGLRSDREGLRFTHEHARPTGIISTKPMMVREAGELGLSTVFRIFMIDQAAYTSGTRSIQSCSPSYVEVMPGLVFDVIHQLQGEVQVPLIAGGMVKTKEQVARAFASGASAVSTSNSALLRHYGRQ